MPQFDFQNRHGQNLAGRLELPQATPKAIGIFAHCFTCSKNVKAATQLTRQLAKLGMGVLRFDFTGLGNSEGDFANSNFSSNVTDLVDAATALQKHHQAPSLLVGHSLGGAAALIAAEQIESVKAVATIGAPSEPAHLERLIGNSATGTGVDGSITISLGGRQIQLSPGFVEDLRSNRVAQSIQSHRKPLLVMHSPIDAIVSIDNARQLFEAAKHPKSFVSIDGADHMLSDSNDGQFVAEMLAAWAARYSTSQPTHSSH